MAAAPLKRRSPLNSRLHRWLVIGLLVSSCSGGAEQTEVEPEGEFLPYADRIDLVVECVRSRGFAASSYEGFGVMVSAAGEEQLELAAQVEGDCWEEIEERFPAPPPLSLAETYRYLLVVARCLENLGYEISEPPTLEAYLESAASRSDMWNPYNHLGLQGVDTHELQREKCPPQPWYR